MGQQRWGIVEHDEIDTWAVRAAESSAQSAAPVNAQGYGALDPAIDGQMLSITAGQVRTAQPQHRLTGLSRRWNSDRGRATCASGTQVNLAAPDR